jgi:hypothetical protein
MQKTLDTIDGFCCLHADRSELILEQMARQPMRDHLRSQIVSHVSGRLGLFAAFGMDFISSGARSATLSPYLRGTVERPHAQPRRLRHSRHRGYLSRSALDHLLQVDRAGAYVGRRSRYWAAATCPVRVSGRTCQPDYRRHVGSALCEDWAGHQHQTRPQPQGQSANFSQQPVLGNAGTGRASSDGFRADGADSLLADRRILATRQTLGGAPVDRFDKWPRQRGVLAGQRLAYASESDFPSARTTGAHNRSGTARYGIVLTPETRVDALRTETQVWVADRLDNARNDAGEENETDVVWRGPVAPRTVGHRRGAIFEGAPGAGRVVRDAAVRQHMVAPALDTDDRNGSVYPRGTGNLCRTLGHRALVSQPEALVGCDESVAAVEVRAGIVDADSFHSVCLDPNACPEVVGVLSFVRNCPLAEGSDDHGRTFQVMAANPIYRTSRTRRLRPEVRPFPDALTRSGSSFAVLSRVALSSRYYFSSSLRPVHALHQRSIVQRKAPGV